jgi:hypothetical protein
MLTSQVRRGIEDFLRRTFPMHTPYFDGVMERLAAGGLPQWWRKNALPPAVVVPCAATAVHRLDI